MKTKEIQELSGGTERAICNDFLVAGKKVELFCAYLDGCGDAMRIIRTNDGDEVFIDNAGFQHTICDKEDCDCEEIHRKNIASYYLCDVIPDSIK
jgi:hypothetical protein